MPDRLVAERVGVGRLDREGHEPQRAAALLPRRERRVAAHEVALLERHEAVEPGLVGAVGGAELARPVAEPLLEPHGVEGPAAEEAQAEVLARRDQQVVELALVLALDPDLVAEVARETHAPDQRRQRADVRLGEAHEREGRGREVGRHEAPEELA